jgi:hypothetical protein
VPNLVQKLFGAKTKALVSTSEIDQIKCASNMHKHMTKSYKQTFSLDGARYNHWQNREPHT